MLIILEGIAMCFVLLIICVIGIANGPVGLVIFYEEEVQKRVVELKYTTKEKITKTKIITMIALFTPILIGTPLLVYCVNGAAGFLSGFWQMTAILLIMGLFDRIFIDWYWVEHTKAWLIPETEDLMPLIPAKTRIKKWIVTIVGYPIVAAIMAGLLAVIIK